MARGEMLALGHRTLAMSDVTLSALARYSVAPRAAVMPQPPRRIAVKYDSTDYWEIAPTCGCVLAVLAIIAAFNAIAPSARSIGGCFKAVVVAIVAAFAFVIVLGVLWHIVRKASLQARADKARDEQWERDKQETRTRSEREAEQTTAQLRSLLIESAQLRDGLFESLQNAEDALIVATAEYDERVIPAFWDAVEFAAAALGEYDELLEELVQNAQRYYETLKGRRHTFPPFPYISADLPSEDELVKRFKRVVRLGQSDYQFANIWEKRRVREAITTGFGSLERAVRGVGQNIVSAVAAVQNTLDAGFDRIVDAHVSARADAIQGVESVVAVIDSQRKELLDILHSQNSKLDNIQWHRKPLGSRYIRE